MRLLAALAGVAFANILIFMQLGFLGALSVSTKLPYQLFDADVLIYSPETNTLGDAGTLPRQRVYQALAVPGTASATPVYVGSTRMGTRGRWHEQSAGLRSRPCILPLKGGEIARMRNRLRLEDVALLDRKTRSLPRILIAQVEAGKPYAFEAAGLTIIH